MRTLRLLLAALMLCAVPLSAQDASDRQLRQRTDFAIARVENSIEEMEALLAHVRQLYDDLHARITADSLAVEEPSPPDTTAPAPPPPPPPPPPDTTTPPPLSAEFPNLPAGFTTIFDEKFEAPWSGTCPSGWSGCAVWRPQNVSMVTDATAPGFTGTGALRTALPAGANGGVLTMERSFGASYDAIYVSYWVKWDRGYDHNGTSEKLLNFGGLTGPLFQFHWNAESIFYIRPARPEDHVIDGGIHANLMPRRGDGVFDAPPPPSGQWTHYEILFEKSAGRVRWWTNGEPRADHQGVNLSGFSLSSIVYNDTWGGGGSKGDSGGRLSGRLYVAGVR